MIELFKIGFVSFTLIDVVDISLATLLFYWVYRALRNTVAVQILVGLIILIIVSLVVNSANMKALTWITNAITNIWLLAFIVLFQPEIRRILTQITRTRIFRVFVRTDLNQTIEEVLEATKQCSEKHIGALIVFTRNQNVRFTLDTGIPLQAVVSAELLLTVFNPRSPLHDGAVIIDNQIIVAARCVLPLSNEKKVKGRVLGTRHKAALGISEQSDVLVLVVSEETGSISLAQHGRLFINIAFDNLREELVQRLSDTNEQQIIFDDSND